MFYYFIHFCLYRALDLNYSVHIKVLAAKGKKIDLITKFKWVLTIDYC